MMIGLLLALVLGACGTKGDPIQVLQDTMSFDIPQAEVTPGVDTIDDGKIHYFHIKGMMDYGCATCHSTELSGADRFDAPLRYNYNTYATCKAGAKEGLETVVENEMPPSMPFSAEAKALYKQWIKDGMLE
jgi:hypothetical protein